ncbi:histidinol dehydrogenase [Paenibacillus sp. J2TS4]|uniref:histidinol dehydrogenase n=1 Tax=Paenibacillus sp. J2TS4 TaxID=2807194 RepID=UPI001B1FEBE5|nr:histidinol dehydrogenase [Paenibacillus sp. J2TS4]GIP34488.1 histidinol dehydrogenase [Paenibacillus sp. J2TS4]
MASNIYRFPEDREVLAQRFQSHKELFNREVLTGVYSIFDDVGRNQDAGIRKATQAFDKVVLDNLVLAEAYIENCISSLTPDLRTAIDQAIQHVREVNLALMPESWKKEIRPGTVVGEKISPLESVGIWIPARKGPLLSTSIMLVTAAKVAGVPRIVVGMPPLQDGLGDPGTVAAAKLAGADQFVVGNGVSIIAGLAQGTESIPEVDGIYGPGPGGIAAAMSVALAFGKRTVVGLGPTESVILADESADPATLANDLINEAEHGPDSSSLLVTPSDRLARQVEAQLWLEIEKVDERRQPFLKRVFGPEGKGAIVVLPDMDSACQFINDFAPEHLMIVCEEKLTKYAMDKITNAGEILIGSFTPFSAANYGIGITAVLPTNGYAKAFSGITAKDMVKYSTIGQLNQAALRDIYPIIEQMGLYEQLPCHVKAANVRLAKE